MNEQELYSAIYKDILSILDEDRAINLFAFLAVSQGNPTLNDFLILMTPEEKEIFKNAVRDSFQKGEHKIDAAQYCKFIQEMHNISEKYSIDNNTAGIAAKAAEDACKSTLMLVHTNPEPNQKLN